MRVTGEIATATIGMAFVTCALAANQHWLDRHFLPSFFLPRDWYVLLETVVRAAIVVVGLSLVGPLRSRIARAVERSPEQPLAITIAVLLAAGASEWALRRMQSRPTGWLKPAEEPLRRPDDRLGWVLVPARTGHATIGGRNVDYVIDAAGYRVSRVGAEVDPERPTILFAGESVMFGEGLQWDETIPAQVEARLGIQSANLAVHGYSSDQTYLRLEQELPRFRRPVAVAALFMTALLGRTLDRDRPHLAPGLVWQPAEHASRLTSLAGFLGSLSQRSNSRSGCEDDPGSAPSHRRTRERASRNGAYRRAAVRRRASCRSGAAPASPRRQRPVSSGPGRCRLAIAVGPASQCARRQSDRARHRRKAETTLTRTT
jgi:hypothetical protein